MINTREELLHESSLPDFVESYRISVISKRDKFYGFSNITWIPQIHEIGIYSFFNYSDFATTSNQIIKDSAPKKSFGTQRCKYTIIQPLKESKLLYKDSNLMAHISLFDFFPYYESIHSRELSKESFEHMTSSYFTRCKAKVSLEFTTKSRTTKKTFDCIGFKEHTWGLYPYNFITCDSRVVVHFRDQTIAFRYIEYNGMSYSYGCISRKNGNLALVLIELEFLSIKNSLLESSEFTYKDAQDDIDLIVSKPIKIQTIDVPKKVKKSHIHVISFSDFTVIGTNKKGYGIEEHYISFDRLKNTM
ncbi:MAG: hypothetical protein N3F66_04580 [Spirochaetes bacterium]|nr:hypothetical protein [Spirochaetota bacterium]